jgi:hypothetical protein
MDGAAWTPPSLSRRRHGWNSAVTGGVVVAALTLGFFLLFWNRFSALRDGNGAILCAQLTLAGKLPYRDWYAAAPPLYFLKAAALVRVLGSDLIALRAFALLERVALALVVYMWLARFFRVSHAALGAVVGIVISAGDLADPLVSYNHDTIFWGVSSGLCASVCIGLPPRRRWAAAALSGLCAGLCLATKQSIGMGISVAVPAMGAAYLLRSEGFRSAVKLAAWFLAGWAIPIAAVGAWLHGNGILEQAVRCIFLRAPSAKGLGSPLPRIVFANLSWATVFAIVATFVCIAVVSRRGSAQLAEEPRAALFKLLAPMGAAILAGAAVAYSGLIPYTGWARASIDFTLVTCGLLASFYGLLWMKRTLSEGEAQFWLFAGVSFVIAFLLFLSWPVFEAMVMPGLPFLVALLLDASASRKRYAAAVPAICGVLLLTQTADKLTAPYAFNGWRDAPVRLATEISSLPEMHGFRLPKDTVRLIDGVTDIIRKRSAPGDAIFTYPSMPLFYYLSGRRIATYSGGHNIDAVPDAVAESDAATLLRTRPAVIVYYDFPPGFVEWEEALWRGGRPSGQRAIVAAIARLSREYELAGSFTVPMTGGPVKVLARPRAAGSL